MKLLRRVRAGLAGAALAALALAEGSARAEPEPAAEPSPPPAPEDDTRDPAFRYVGGTPPANVLRTVIEEGIILGVGYFQYLLDKNSNSADFDLGVSWSSLRDKFLFEEISFDNNRFNTNWVLHPFAGWAYYSAARGNRLGILPSFAVAFASSAFWEFVGEFREQVAINDLIVTPMAGMALGETTTQLGAFLQRSRRTPTTFVLGWLFGPFKALHDTLDGLTPEPPEGYDDLGFPNDVWHRFYLGADAGVTKQADGLLQTDGRVQGYSRLSTLPHYGAEGTASRWFHSGEMSSMAIRAATGGGELVDFNLATSFLAAGHYAQNVGLDPHGRLRGSGTVAGLHLGFEYSYHDYDRDRRLPADHIALVSAGPSFEHSLYGHGVTLRVRADSLATFGGVHAYALTPYERAYGTAGLTSVMAREGYYHALGVTLRPIVEVEAGPFDAGGDVRADWFEGITGADREAPVTGNETPASDVRLTTRAWVGVTPIRHVRLGISTEYNARSGRVGPASASRSEFGIYGGAGLKF